MSYYIFRNIDENENKTYGFVRGEKITEESKQYAFKVLETLPVAGPEFDGKEFRLDYDEETETFFWTL